MRYYRLFEVANEKARNAIDNFRVILNKIHLSLFTASLRGSFSFIYSQHLTILGSCYCKKQIDVSFFMRLSSY